MSFSYKNISYTITTLLMAPAAHAYIGPGVSLSAIGVLIALIIALFASLFGFIWLPLKRLLINKQRKKNNDSNHESAENKEDINEEDKP